MCYDPDEDQQHTFSGKVIGSGEEPIPSKLAKNSGDITFSF